MSTAPAPAVATTPEAARIRVFIDYWNLQLTLNEKEGRITGRDDVRFKVDWRGLPAWLAQKAAEIAKVKNHSFEGAIIYASYNPNTAEGRGFHSWATTWLNRQPGIQVRAFARHPRSLLRCPTCHHEIRNCPRHECGALVTGTVEKGVDTAIATDMIRLAWESSYHIGVLASSDADLVPAAQFLDSKGLKIIQAGFPPSGVDLATSCWASFDMFADRAVYQRQ